MEADFPLAASADQRSSLHLACHITQADTTTSYRIGASISGRYWDRAVRIRVKPTGSSKVGASACANLEAAPRSWMFSEPNVRQVTADLRSRRFFVGLAHPALLLLSFGAGFVH